MTGIVARLLADRLVRTAIEVAVVAVGWALGGTLGVGTVVYALAIGPLVHPLLPILTVRPAGAAAVGHAWIVSGGGQPVDEPIADPRAARPGRCPGVVPAEGHRVPLNGAGRGRTARPPQRAPREMST